MTAVAHGIIRNFRHIFFHQRMIANPAAGGKNACPCGNGGFAAGILGGNGINTVLMVDIGNGGILQHGNAVFLAQGNHPLHDISAALTILMKGGNLGTVGTVENIGALFVQLLHALAGIAEKIEKLTGSPEGVVSQGWIQLPIGFIHHLPQCGKGVVWDAVVLLPAAAVDPPVRSTHGAAAKVPALFHHNHLLVGGFRDAGCRDQSGTAAA